MSSRFTNRRRVQPPPKICRDSQRGPDGLPYCKNGPNVGPTIQGIVKVTIPNFSGYRALLFRGPLHYNQPTDDWRGVIEDQVGDHLAMRIRFDCSSQLGFWELDQLNGPWPPQPAWATANISYRGPKNFDTLWLPADAPLQNPNWQTILRSFL
jgi:hypothetical protein